MTVIRKIENCYFAQKFVKAYKSKQDVATFFVIRKKIIGLGSFF